MQTLLITIILILTFFPRLFFSIGFWLSVLGVFYIFLYLKYFSHVKKTLNFFLIPIWVYLMMLPTTIYIFKSFSIYNPLSIIMTIIFSIFYPISIFLHVIGFGELFDFILKKIVYLHIDIEKITLNRYIFLSFIVLSIFAVFSKRIIYLLLFYSLAIFFYCFSFIM